MLDVAAVSADVAAVPQDVACCLCLAQRQQQLKKVATSAGTESAFSMIN